MKDRIVNNTNGKYIDIKNSIYFLIKMNICRFQIFWTSFVKTLAAPIWFQYWKIELKWRLAVNTGTFELWKRVNCGSGVGPTFRVDTDMAGALVNLSTAFGRYSGSHFICSPYVMTLGNILSVVYTIATLKILHIRRLVFLSQ